MTFGAHTLTHPDLTRLSCDRLELEVVGGKAVIGDALGAEVAPYGRYDNQCREVTFYTGKRCGLIALSLMRTLSMVRWVIGLEYS